MEIYVGTIVKKKSNKQNYYVKKLWPKYAEIEKVNKNYMEKLGEVTEYVDIDDLEASCND